MENLQKAPDRYGDSYIKAVYHLGKDLDPEGMQRDLDEILSEYEALIPPSPTLNTKEDTSHQKRVWLYAPGEGAYLWGQFYQEGVAGIGWDEMGDLKNFSSREQVRDRLLSLHPRWEQEPKE